MSYIREWVKELRKVLESKQINKEEHKCKAEIIHIYIKAINDLKDKKDEYEGMTISKKQINFLVDKINETFEGEAEKKEKLQELDKLFIIEEEN